MYLEIGWRLADERHLEVLELLEVAVSRRQDAPGGSVRGERANFTRLVLGCIEAKFCK